MGERVGRYMNVTFWTVNSFWPWRTLADLPLVNSQNQTRCNHFLQPSACLSVQGRGRVSEQGVGQSSGLRATLLAFPRSQRTISLTCYLSRSFSLSVSHRLSQDWQVEEGLYGKAASLCVMHVIHAGIGTERGGADPLVTLALVQSGSQAGSKV